MSITTRKKLDRRKRRIAIRNDRKKDDRRDKKVLGAAPIRYDVDSRNTGTADGGAGLMRQLIDSVGIANALDANLSLLQVHRPYHESDHVLAFALNALCGGTCIEDFEHRRKDEGLLNSIGAYTFPDPTTAGDFCRRFTPETIEACYRPGYQDHPWFTQRGPPRCGQAGPPWFGQVGPGRFGQMGPPLVRPNRATPRCGS